MTASGVEALSCTADLAAASGSSVTVILVSGVVAAADTRPDEIVSCHVM